MAKTITECAVYGEYGDKNVPYRCTHVINENPLETNVLIDHMREIGFKRVHLQKRTTTVGDWEQLTIPDEERRDEK